MANVRKTSEYMPTPQKDEKLFKKSLSTLEKEKIKQIGEIRVEDFSGSLQSFISNEVFTPCKYLVERKGQELNKDDYEMGFKSFRKLLKEINKVTVYTPTPITFSQFMGVTLQTFKNHANQNNERGDVARSIMDILTENHIQNMLSDKFHPVTGVFTAKSLYGLKDNENASVNILNINASQKSVDDILAEYNKTTI